MIKDLTTRDKQLLVNQLVESVFAATDKYYVDLVFDIARRNQEAKKSPLMTFRFGGKTYKFESEPVRFPQTLAGFLQPELNEINARLRELEEESAYIRAALVAAVGRAESATHLYQLLPDVLHSKIQELGIKRELDLEHFQPLPDDLVNEFKTKHAFNLDKLFQRVTKNVLGGIK